MYYGSRIREVDQLEKHGDLLGDVAMDSALLLSAWGTKFLWVGLGIFSFILFVFAFRDVIWLLNYPFMLLNWMQWILYNPLRFLWKNTANGWSALIFGLLRYSFIAFFWWLIVHILLIPIRLLNALYFNVLLYWSVIFCDSIFEFWFPRLKYGQYRGFRGWFIYLPLRLYNVFKRNGYALLGGILMTGVDTVFPTYTMYHGTSFKGIATNIAQAGRWYVGGGDYAGSGIYFGFLRKTAEHYAQGSDRALICARVTVFPCRNSATLPYKIRKKIGNDGAGISSGLPFPYCSIEHWRDHSYAQWFEYCLVQPGLAGKYVRTWRARPICVLKNGMPKRIWGGISLWTGSGGGYGVIGFSWSLIAACLYLYHYHGAECISWVMSWVAQIAWR